MKRTVSIKCLSLVLAVLLCLSLIPSNGGMVQKAQALSQNQQNIVNRADYLYSLVWTAQKTVTAHAYNSYYTFYAGQQYHLPYGQGPTANYIGYGVSPADFMAAASNPNSVFYQSKSYAGTWYSTYYITDCSGFVSWCWGLTAKQSTRTLANYSSYVASVTQANIRNYLQVGDILNRYDYHVVLVTDLIYDSAGTLTGIEITEQNIPHTLRQVYTPAGLASTYASYDGIYRYNGTVPASPVVVQPEETWIEKACFDAMVYRDRNKDLANLTDAQLKEHWLNHGIKEGRPSSTILDLQFYLNNNPDLKTAYGTDYEKVYKHFITSGYKEYRKSSALFDGQYYTQKYPDVASSFKELYLKHYVETGIKEGRRASLTFDPNYYWFIRPDVATAWPGDYEMCARHYAGHGVNDQIEAYDKSYPTVSDVKVYDVTAAGYTVTCKVVDNWGVSKVVFPTWTVLNDQDDLAENFMNTQKGTKNGDVFTFRVNATDHNNEGGAYVTHIYAVDRGGNQTVIQLDEIQVKDPDPTPKPDPTPDPTPDPDPEPELERIELNASAEYVRDGDLLTNIPFYTTVEELLTRFDNQALEVLDKKGNAVSGSTMVGTGVSLNLYSDDLLVDSVTVMILGDVDGNGGVDVTDYMRVKAAILGELQLDPLDRIAADVDLNGAVNSTDYMRLKAHFLGTFDLIQQLNIS